MRGKSEINFMRKKITIIAAIFLIANAASAQKTTFGVNLGFNSSNLAFTLPDGAFNTDSRKGIYAGFTADYEINEVLFFHPEVNFAMTGASRPGIKNRTTFNLNYVNVPLMVSFISEPFSFYGGPQVSYLISANGIIKKDGVDSKFDLKDNFKNIDISALLGVGYTMENGFGGDVRFQLGYFNIANNNNPNINFISLGPDSKINVNAVQLGLHYKFIKKKIKKPSNM